MQRQWLSFFSFSLVFALLLLVTTGPAAAQPSGDCALVDVTVTASISSDPGYIGLYKYTAVGNWDVTRLGLSHLDIFVALQECACKCDANIFKFKTPAGISSGMNPLEGACTVQYLGSYVCKGDPSIPDELAAPTIKFDTEGPCQALTIGSGTWVFYSPFPPAPYSEYVDAVSIKHGSGTCMGDLKGNLPLCDCSVPVESRTWGQMKALYR